MSKYKLGDKFILEIGSVHDDGWYGIKRLDENFIEPEIMLDKLERYYPHPFEEDVATVAVKKYRPWHQLLKEPADMTQDEKERLARIKAIPSVAFEAARKREVVLWEQIRAFEKERDELSDFLNGEV